MEYDNSGSVRFQDDLEFAKLPVINGDGTQVTGSTSKKVEKRLPRDTGKTGKPLKAKALLRVFSEDYERVKGKILDPRGQAIRRWNKIFLVACLVSFFVDPLFFYLPSVLEKACVTQGIRLEVALTIVRSVADVLYTIQIWIRFRTAYVAPSSRVFGRGELVIDPSKIASRYLRGSLRIDLLAAVPLPQVLIWLVIPNLHSSTTTNTIITIRFILMFQYILRLFLIYPFSQHIIKETGIITETAWVGAANNLMFYMLASHVTGACWYLLSVERLDACWRSVCNSESSSCQNLYLDCRMVNNPERESWFQSSNITDLCNPSSSTFQFGIYGDAVNNAILAPPFLTKFFYCLWWGLRNLSSTGQNLSTSSYVWENVFATIVSALGLVLFASLIGNMQRYLQSTTVRLEEWRVKRTDTEQWMHHRQLPPELRQSIRKYDRFKWIATRGVDEESLLKDLPVDLRRGVKRHLCFDLVRRVPLFSQMDETMLDAICERTKPALYTEGSFLVREGDPVNEMLFIIRGHLDSYTTNGGRTGFFNTCRIGPCDFCGEELLTWALNPRPGVILPSSTRTVKAISEVEAFALRAEDLMFVASQFRRLHSKQLRHKFRFYSHQWRTWAACFIQAAWRRFKARKMAADTISLPSGSRWVAYAAMQFAKCTRRGNHSRSGSDVNVTESLQKPAEPDFSVDED